MAIGLISKFNVYEERTGKYLSYFKHYVGNAKVIVDVGCGEGAFSRALACRKHLVCYGEEFSGLPLYEHERSRLDHYIYNSSFGPRMEKFNT